MPVVQTTYLIYIFSQFTHDIFAEKCYDIARKWDLINNQVFHPYDQISLLRGKGRPQWTLRTHS